MTETENHSTGPRTEEGKQRSSQNAIKHGLFAKLLLLPGESQEQFDALLNGFKENHKPHGATEDSLVYRLAEIHWRLGRIPNLEALAIEKAPGGTANSSAITASTLSASTATSSPPSRPSIRNKPSAWWITAGTSASPSSSTTTTPTTNSPGIPPTMGSFFRKSY